MFINKGVFFFFLICECIYLERLLQGRTYEIESNKWLLWTVNIKNIKRTVASHHCWLLKNWAKFNLSLFLCHLSFLFFKKETMYAFYLVEIKVRRKGTISHQEEWVKADKDTEKPRTGMAISPRILRKRAVHLQTQQDSQGWWTAGTGLGGGHRRTNQIEFPNKAKQQGNRWFAENKAAAWQLLPGKPPPPALRKPENPRGSIYRSVSGRDH